MRFISWNVNGLRACMQKGFLDVFDMMNADFFCLQETKLQEGQIDLDLPGYEQYWCYAEKKGYSGTAIFTKHTPLSVAYGMGIPELDTEGRLITLEYKEFYLVTCYTPNAQRGLARIAHRMKWEDAFREYLMDLDSKKPVILCGDLNVAHEEIDLKNPGSNRGNAGFSDEERSCFTRLLESGFTDTFRHLHPDATGAYTWWSYMFNARQNNTGWRIDYFLVSERLKEQIYSTPIYPEIMGSDHCPVGLDMDLLCNGGIWSPETEDASPINPLQEKKAPKGTAALLSVLLCLLLGVGIFSIRGLPREAGSAASTEPTLKLFDFPTYDDRYISVCEFSDPLTELYASTYGPLSSYLQAYFSDGETWWQIADVSTDYTEKLGNLPANYWLRIDLTEEGKRTLSENTVLTLYCQDIFYGNSNVINNYTYTSSLDKLGAVLTTRCYYDSYGTFSGWFVYGYLPKSLNLQIHIPIDRRTSTLISVIATPYTGFEITTPD